MIMRLAFSVQFCRT